MKTAVLLSLLLCAAQALAAPEPIPRSKSPDKHYLISVEQTDGRIYYRIDTNPGGKPLLKIAGSYQPELGAPDWVYEKSHDLTVHWRNDSRAVALEEANHRGIGTVLVAIQTADGFCTISIGTQALLKATNESWKEGRLFFRSWGKNDIILLDLIGTLIRENEVRTYEQSAWRFELDLAHDGKVVHQEKKK